VEKKIFSNNMNKTMETLSKDLQQLIVEDKQLQKKNYNQAWKENVYS